MDEWRRCTAEEDLDGLLALTADHAVFLTPRQAPMTKTEFAAGFRKITAKARIDSRQQLKDLGVCDDLAYAWSYLTVAMTGKANGERSEVSGHVLSVFRKNAAGVWQLTRDANLLLGAGNPGRS